MKPPESGLRPKTDETYKSQPEEEGSPLKSQESAERKLDPEKAVYKEDERLGGILMKAAEAVKRAPRELKLAGAGMLALTALTFGRGTFQPAEAAVRGEHTARQERIVSHPLNAEQKFQRGAEKLWGDFTKQIQQYRVQGAAPEALRNLDHYFLNMVYNTHLLEEWGDPQETPERFYARLESQISNWVSQYIFEMTQEFSPKAHEAWVKRLNERMPLLFDADGNGKLDREEKGVFRQDLKANFGLSALDHLSRGGLFQNPKRGERASGVSDRDVSERAQSRVEDVGSRWKTEMEQTGKKWKSEMENVEKTYEQWVREMQENLARPTSDQEMRMLWDNWDNYSRAFRGFQAKYARPEAAKNQQQVAQSFLEVLREFANFRGTTAAQRKIMNEDSFRSVIAEYAKKRQAASPDQTVRPLVELQVALGEHLRGLSDSERRALLGESLGFRMLLGGGIDDSAQLEQRSMQLQNDAAALLKRLETMPTSPQAHHPRQAEALKQQAAKDQILNFLLGRPQVERPEALRALQQELSNPELKLDPRARDAIRTILRQIPVELR